MLIYICAEVEMSTRGVAWVLTFQLKDIYICMSHKSIMRHLFWCIANQNVIKQYQELTSHWH